MFSYKDGTGPTSPQKKIIKSKIGTGHISPGPVSQNLVHLITWISGEIRQKSCCNLFKALLKIAPWFQFYCSKNEKLPWLGSVSFETCFENWPIFEVLLWAEIFEKQLWTFGQSLILNVFLHIFKIKEIVNILQNPLNFLELIHQNIHHIANSNTNY